MVLPCSWPFLLSLLLGPRGSRLREDHCRLGCCCDGSRLLLVDAYIGELVHVRAVVQYFLSPLLLAHGFLPALLSSALYAAALSYYHYVNFLGYDGQCRPTLACYYGLGRTPQTDRKSCLSVGQQPAHSPLRGTYFITHGAEDAKGATVLRDGCAFLGAVCPGGCFSWQVRDWLAGDVHAGSLRLWFPSRPSPGHPFLCSFALLGAYDLLLVPYRSHLAGVPHWYVFAPACGSIAPHATARLSACACMSHNCL